MHIIGQSSVQSHEQTSRNCKHNQGFALVLLVNSATIPAIWWCSKNCSFWLPFDPDLAGTLRSPVKIGELTLDDITGPDFWGNKLIAYTERPKGCKVMTLSKDENKGQVPT